MFKTMKQFPEQKSFGLKRLFIVVAVLFFSLMGTAQASSWSVQSNADDQSTKQFVAMNKKIAQMVAAYADSDDLVYWGSPGIVTPWNGFKTTWTSYKRGLAGIQSQVARAVENRTKIANSKIQSVSPRACLSKTARTRVSSLLNQARSSRDASKSLYASAMRSVQTMKKHQGLAENWNGQISKKNEQSFSMTDGYIDDEIYQFGSKQTIAMPKPKAVKASEFDPAIVEPLVDAIGWTDYYADPLFKGDFLTGLNRAATFASSAQRANSC